MPRRPSNQRPHHRWGPAALAVTTGLVVGVGPGGDADADVIVVVPGCVVDPSDVIGWWPGEGDLRAAIGPDLTGPATYGAALFGTGIEFDQGTDVSVAGLDVVTTAMTLEMWFRPTGASNGRMETLASRWQFPGGDDDARGYALFLDPSGAIVFTPTRSPCVGRSNCAPTLRRCATASSTTWPPPGISRRSRSTSTAFSSRRRPRRAAR